MKQHYFSDVSCVEPNFIRIEVKDEDDKLLASAQVAVDNHQVRKDAAHIAHMPLEELEYGLYGEPTNKMLTGIIDECVKQTPVLTPAQIESQKKALEDWKKKHKK